MIQTRRIPAFFIFLILTIVVLCGTIHAEELFTPNDLELQTFDTPEIRNSFYYADVRDDGWFVLMSHNSDSKDPNWMLEQFFDIYDAEGQFYRTVRLVTRNNVYFKLTQDTLDLYMISPYEVIHYDLNSGEATVSPSDLTDAEIRKLNSKKRISVGAWTYGFKGIARPYSAFYRKDGTRTQILVQAKESTPAEKTLRILSILKGLFGVAVLGFAIVLIRKIKRGGRKQAE